MKALVIWIANVLAWPYRLLPAAWRDNAVFALLVLHTRHPDPREGLKRAFAVYDRLDLLTSERAMALGAGEHPKHRLTDYHRFFIEHIEDGERVLDVGCGYGAVARTIARARPTAAVVGVDYDAGRLAQAKASDNPANLSFIAADVTKTPPPGAFDVVILSNVLEHIDDRPGLLQAICANTQAKRVLIRVPLFERDWRMAMRRELGVNYYSDDDHRIEHTRAEFLDEMAQADLEVRGMLTVWGEIWATCVPKATAQ